MNSRERDEFRPKKEGDNLNYKKLSSRQWSSHKNPRIVRVSRAFGGKDRHSKVCTVRGLRDRRIRLSVPTAIQLYDLQYKLGLSQPSKVIDWLLDATKHDIDKLPPLPMLPGNFTQFHQPTQVTNSHDQNTKSFGLVNPAKEGTVQDNQEGLGGFMAHQLSAQNLFPMNNQPSFPNLPHNYNSYVHLDPSSLSLSHVGGGFPLSNQTGDHQFHNTFLNSSSQLYLCPSAANVASIIPSFPSFITQNPMENEWRQMNNMQNVHQNPLLATTLQLISPPTKPFALNVNSKSGLLQQNHNEICENEERR